MRVAVILTGELRYIDYCRQWWNNVTAEQCNHDVDMYSCTWAHLNNAFTDPNKKAVLEDAISRFRNPSTVLGQHYPGIEYLIVDDNELVSKKVPESFRKYCGPGAATSGIAYHLGRVYQLQRAMLYWSNLKSYDVIVHSRWDMAFRNTNFFNDFIEQATDNVTFKDLRVEKGTLYSCDWAYAGPASVLHKHYINAIDKHIEIFDYYYKKDPTTAYTFLIGHNIHSTYLQHCLLTLDHGDYDSTLIRKHEMEFEYSENQWQQLNKLFLG